MRGDGGQWGRTPVLLLCSHQSVPGNGNTCSWEAAPESSQLHFTQPSHYRTLRTVFQNFFSFPQQRFYELTALPPWYRSLPAIIRKSRGHQICFQISHCSPCKSGLQSMYKSTKGRKAAVKSKHCWKHRDTRSTSWNLSHFSALLLSVPMSQMPHQYHLGSANGYEPAPHGGKDLGPHTCLSGLSAMKNVISSHQSWGQPGESRSAAGPGSAESKRT